MHRKISLVFVFFCLITVSFAQLPVSIGSDNEVLAEYQKIQQADYHTGVKPFFITSKDTFFVRPVIELHAYGVSDNYGYMGIGAQVYWSKNRFSLWSAVPFGLARTPDWWQNSTVPFVGRAAHLDNDYDIWIDPRIIVSYQTKYILFQAGRSKFHLGEGYNSLWLSEFTPAMPFVRAQVRLKHVLYGYQINYLQNPDQRFDGKIKHAFNFTHYFDFSFGPLNLDMFETVVQDPIDSLGAHRGLDINYLNPVIFFRAIDLMLGSPDNVLLGLGGSLRVMKKILFYGYGVLDEMLVSHLLSGDKCWCLKYGANAGMKLFYPMGKNMLYFQGELSAVRPYTYSHDNPILAYGNLYQPLGHPLGANFYQALAKTSFIKQKKLSISLLASYSIYGQDIDTLNYGKNIYRSYLSRVRDMGVITTQGKRTNLTYIDLTISKEITSNLWLKTGIIFTHLSGQKNQILVHLAITSGILNPRWDWR